MSMKEATIQINDLSIGYHSKNDTKLVASHITTTIYSGELTCLLGANGVGKSTLLRTLSAFQPRISGEIALLSRDIQDYSDKELSTIVGVVLTDKCEIRNMTVRELIGMGRSPYTGFWGRLGKEDKQIVEESISLVRIENLASRMVHTLSDGERQKVMIAKALAQETPVIFLDEPTAFLDFPSKVEIMQLLHSLTRSTIADKIWLMDRENGISTGTPEDLALSGSLSGFFARKGIVFDMETGLFRIDNQYDKKIRLVGDGQKYAMVRKALLRTGIYAGSEIESESWIDVGDAATSAITLYFSNGQQRQVASIEELLLSL